MPLETRHEFEDESDGEQRHEDGDESLSSLRRWLVTEGIQEPHACRRSEKRGEQIFESRTIEHVFLPLVKGLSVMILIKHYSGNIFRQTAFLF